MAKEQTSSTDEPKPGSYAIVETSGSQFWVEPNRYYDFNRLQADVDETVILENVLLIPLIAGLNLLM